jgi:hypothetical protein
MEYIGKVDFGGFGILPPANDTAVLGRKPSADKFSLEAKVTGMKYCPDEQNITKYEIAGSFVGWSFLKGMFMGDELEFSVGLYKLNSVYPYLESAWFQPLNHNMKRKPVSKFPFKCNLYRYVSAIVYKNELTDAVDFQINVTVGLDKLTHSLKAPGFNP